MFPVTSTPERMKMLKTAVLAGFLVLSISPAIAQQSGGNWVSHPPAPPRFGTYHRGDSNIVIPFPPQGMFPQPMGLGTSAATYSNGRIVTGAIRTPNGVVHLSTGLVVAPGEVVSPMGINYGPQGTSGFYHGHPGPGWGPMGSQGWPSSQEFPPTAGQLVPLGAPYPYGIPYFGGMNPHYPGSVLGTTLLNMSYSMRPSVASTAVYAGPRLMFMNPTLMATAPSNLTGTPISDAAPAPIPDAQSPLLNEFEAYPREPGESSLPDRINSLRYQSAGDEAFRNEDYRKAEEAYQAGLDLAPDRPGLWIRLAFANVAGQNFPEAVRCLKTGLLTPPDATRAWISADELYGQRAGERARSHGSQLWNWLAEKPLSSDRLLLGGTFQKLRGFDGAAAELLQMARYEGAEADYVASVMALAEGDIGQRAVSHQLGQMIDESRRSKSAAAVSRPLSTKPVGEALQPNSDDVQRIFLRGSNDSAESDSDSTVETLEPQSLPLLIPKL